MIITARPGYRWRTIITVDPQGAASDGTMTIWRQTDTDPMEPVAGATDIPVAGTVVVDTCVPLARPVQYIVTTDDQSAATDLITITPPPIATLGQACLVTHPLTGDVAAVAVVEWKGITHETQGSEIAIPGRRERVLMVDVELLPTSSLVLLTVDPVEAAALDQLCADGDILLLRCSHPDYPDAFISARRRTTDRITRTDPARLHAWQITHYGHPSLGTRAHGDTLGMLHQAVPGTLGDIAARWPGTLLDIAQADLMSEVSG